jgi:hypothetical protein
MGCLTAELANWRQSAIDEPTSSDGLAAIEAGIGKKLREARRRSETRRYPTRRARPHEPGADIRARWQVTAERAARHGTALTTVTLHSFHRRGRKITERVKSAWCQT